MVVINHLKIQEKDSKKFFCQVIPVLHPIFRVKIFLQQLVPDTTIQNKNKKTQAVPGTKYGVFRLTKCYFVCYTHSTLSENFVYG
jgi:hypothetical protein